MADLAAFPFHSQEGVAAQGRGTLAKMLAGLIARCRDEPTFLRGLEQACRDRMPLFLPDCERRSLSCLLDELPAPAPLEDSGGAASGG